MAELLLGLPDSGSITRQSDYIEQSGNWGFFVQDDWKVTPKLTLNLGVRYEFETPLHERFNRSTLGFETTYVQPISAAAQAAYASIYPKISGGFPQLPPSAFALDGGMTFEGLNGNDGGLYHTPKNVFMPRFGLAYQLDNSTVFRGGFGMFAGFLGQRRGDVQQNGFTQTTNMVLTTDSGLHFLTTLANPFPNGVTEPVGAAAGYQTYLGQGFTFFNQNPKVPLTMRWEASLQHQFKNFVLETAYVGSKTNHIEVTRNINTLPRQYLSTSPHARRHVEQLSQREHLEPAVRTGAGKHAGHLYRHEHLAADAALALSGVRIERHQHHGEHRLLLVPQPAVHGHQALRQGLHSHRQLHLLEMAAGCESAERLRPRAGSGNLGPRRAASLQHQQHLVPAVRQETARCCPTRMVSWTGSWAVGRSPASGACRAGSPCRGATSSITAIRRTFSCPSTSGAPEHWFNVANFETASARQLLSNQLRTWPLRFSQIRGPRMNNVDLALIKTTRITEGKSIEFRAEALNAANHPFFPNPNMSATTAQTALDTGFGQISASTVSNYARRLQLALKYVF